MGVDEEVCPACRRPRDELEIESGRDRLREREERRRRRPLTAARWALGIAALVLGFRERRLFHDLFYGLTSGLRAEVHQEIKNVENPGGPGAVPPKTALGAAAIVMLGGPPPPPRSTAPAAVRRPAPAAARVPPAEPEAAPPQIAVRPDEPKEPEYGRRVYGVVYDMKSLRPIASAVVKMTLSRTGSVPRIDPETRTDGNGRYQLDFVPFPSDDAPIVTATADGYRDGQIEDPELSYLQRPQAERLQFIAEITPVDLDSVPLRYPASEVLIPLDLVLVPEVSREK